MNPGCKIVSSQESGRPRPLFLAGHPALGFLNTRIRVKEDVEDLLQSEEDMLIWLKQTGFPTALLAGKTGRVTLLRSARRLRDNVQSLVERRKIG
jgi:hypothetical protein